MPFIVGHWKLAVAINTVNTLFQNYVLLVSFSVFSASQVHMESNTSLVEHAVVGTNIISLRSSLLQDIMWLEWGPACKQPSLLCCASVHTTHIASTLFSDTLSYQRHINTCTHTHILAHFNRRAVKGWTVETLPGEKCADGLLAAAAGWAPALHVKPCKPSRCVYTVSAHVYVSVWSSILCERCSPSL